MSRKMTLIYLKKTKNILAAVTRAATPQDAILKGSESDEQKQKVEKPELGILVGDQLIVRGIRDRANQLKSYDTEFNFPVDQLGVLTTDPKDEVLAKPRSYYLDPGQELRNAIVFSSITATDTKVTVTLPGDVTRDTEIWLQVHDTATGEQQPPMSEKITLTAADKDKIEFNVSLVAGKTYQFLAAGDGFQPVIVEDTI